MTNTYDAWLSVVDGLPPLWPHAPLWPSDPAVKGRALAHLNCEAHEADPLLSNFVRQQQVDARMAHLFHLQTREDPDARRPAAHWIARFVAPAGWVLDAGVVAGFGPGPFKPGDFSLRCVESLGAGLELAPDYDPPGPEDAFPRRCGDCQTPCVSQCMCGEPYCSRACQRRDFVHHRRICETVFDQNTFAWPVSQIEFTRIHHVAVDPAKGFGGPTAQASRCGHCGAVPAQPLRCTGCRAVTYCTRECQKGDWKRHKTRCAALAKAKALEL